MNLTSPSLSHSASAHFSDAFFETGVDSFLQKGTNALIEAVRGNNLESFHLLVNSGANVNNIDDHVSCCILFLDFLDIFVHMID